MVRRCGSLEGNDHSPTNGVNGRNHLELCRVSAYASCAKPGVAAPIRILSASAHPAMTKSGATTCG